MCRSITCFFLFRHYDERSNSFKGRERPRAGFYAEGKDTIDDEKDDSVFFRLPPVSRAIISPPGEETRLFSSRTPWHEKLNSRQQRALFRVSKEFMYKAAQICSVDIIDVKMFFYWAKMDCGYDALQVHFKGRYADVGPSLNTVIMRMYVRHRPYHIGVSPKRPITLEKIENEESTYMSLRVGKEHFGKFIPFSADGSYNRCQSFGGHFGGQELWSYKKTHLSKVNLPEHANFHIKSFNLCEIAFL